jgi:hypothetical protein
MTAMRDLVVLAALAVWLSACGGSAASRGTAPGGAGATSPADGPSCDAAATHIVKVIAAERGGRFVEEAPAMTEVVRTRCTADGWSAEVRRCLVAATERDAARDCVEKLTPEQQDALQRGEQEMRARSRPADGDDDAEEGVPVDMDGEPDAGAAPPEAPARTMAPPPPPAPMPEKEQAEKKKKSRSAPKGDRGRSDPCEGGE